MDFFSNFDKQISRHLCCSVVVSFCWLLRIRGQVAPNLTIVETKSCHNKMGGLASHFSFVAHLNKP